MKRPARNIAAGIEHLQGADPVMRALIQRVGPFRVKPEPDRFRALVRSIISQQISGGAAKSIFRRMLELLEPEGLTPGRLAEATVEALRSAGVSAQKASYLRDLAEKILTGEVRLDGLEGLPDDAIVKQLIQVKGIGVWTAQMFLIFSIGRLDVFPSEDLGVRVALRDLYLLEGLPDRDTSHRIAAAWRPFATIGSWYCWRSLELARPNGRLAAPPALLKERPKKENPPRRRRREGTKS